MRNVTLDFRPAIEPDDVRYLLAVLPGIRENEHLTIVVDRADAHETDELVRILEEHGFDYQPRGGHEHEYSIIARRKNICDQ